MAVPCPDSALSQVNLPTLTLKMIAWESENASSEFVFKNGATDRGDQKTQQSQSICSTDSKNLRFISEGRWEVPPLEQYILAKIQMIFKIYKGTNLPTRSTIFLFSNFSCGPDGRLDTNIV